jgi:hypothetical protein
VELKEVFQNINREAGPAPVPLDPVFVEKLARIIPEALRISLINPLIELSPYQSIAAGLCAGARNHFSDTLTAGASVAAKWPPLLASW